MAGGRRRGGGWGRGGGPMGGAGGGREPGQTVLGRMRQTRARRAGSPARPASSKDLSQGFGKVESMHSAPNPLPPAGGAEDFYSFNPVPGGFTLETLVVPCAIE